jgi:hypothetical protein
VILHKWCDYFYKNAGVRRTLKQQVQIIQHNRNNGCEIFAFPSTILLTMVNPLLQIAIIYKT